MRFRDRAYAISASLTGAFAVFAVGSAFRWTQAVVAVLVAVVLATQFLSRRRLVGWSPLMAGLMVAAGLTAISLIPLPAGLRELLDPVGAGFKDDGTALLETSTWPSLSRDPAASAAALVSFVILLGVAVAVLRTAVQERGRFRLLAAVAIISGAAAFVGVIHTVTGATKLYGVYEMTARPNVIAPLLNENHFGALMALGTCVAIGLAFYSRQRTWVRAVWIVTVLLCAALAVASRSRGATLGVCLGGAITAGLLVAQRYSGPREKRQRGGLSRTSIPMAVVAACMVLVVVYASSGGVADRFSRTSLDEIAQPLSRFAAWRSASKLVDESPWVGVGRGGFETSFTRVHAASGTATFSHVENEYLQAVIDWGIPGALLIGGCLVWAAAVALRRWRDGPLVAGAIGGLSAIAIQSNVDFGIELLGLAVLVVAVAATVCYVPLRDDRGQRFVTTRVLRGAHILALLVGAALLVSPAATTIADDHQTLEQQNVTLAQIRSAVARHPLDYYAYARAALSMRDQRDPRTITLLNHAMRLHPTHPDLHRMAARILYAAGHEEQAALEYAEALRSTRSPTKLIREIVTTYPASQAVAAIPTDYPDRRLIVNTLRDMHQDALASRWLGRVVAANPGDPRACSMLYELSLSLGDLAAAEVAGRNCVNLMPDAQTRLSLATVLARKQGDAEVIRLLADVDTWTGRLDEKLQAWFMLCDAYTHLKQWDRASTCLRRIDMSGIVDDEQRASISTRLEAVAKERAAEAIGSAQAPSSAKPVPAPSSPPAPATSPH